MTCLSDEEFQKAAEILARAQRDEPERAMLRIQFSQIAQIYGFIAEHAGDITNRMSEEPAFFHGNYGAVEEKVRKVGRILNDPYGFEKEMREQVRENLAYLKNKGVAKYSGEAEALAKLKELGKDYADKHRALPVVNEAQTKARDLAVAIGEMRFQDARKLLAELDEKVKQGSEAWMVYAMAPCRPEK